MSDLENFWRIPEEKLDSKENTRPKSPFEDLLFTLNKDDPHRIDASYPENNWEKEELENNSKNRNFEIFVEWKWWVPYDDNRILLNRSWFFEKYCMPTDLPTQINSWENIDLNTWYYWWVIFDIPWTEVYINWQWIPYNDENKSLIRSHLPKLGEWRLNWDLCKKMWYKWKNIQWKIIVVDNNWNSLNISKQIRIEIRND